MLPGLSSADEIRVTIDYGRSHLEATHVYFTYLAFSELGADSALLEFSAIK